MSQVARAKKMFDDISSEEVSQSSAPARAFVAGLPRHFDPVPQSTVPATVMTPPATPPATNAMRLQSLDRAGSSSSRSSSSSSSSAAAGGQSPPPPQPVAALASTLAGESPAEVRAFTPSSASPSQTRQDAPGDDAVQKPTMVAAVHVSNSTEKNSVTKTTAADLHLNTATTVKVAATTTPMKATATTNPSRTLTPATVSKRPSEAVPAAVGGDPRRASLPTGKTSRYGERGTNEEAFPSVTKAGKSRTAAEQKTMSATSDGHNTAAAAGGRQREEREAAAGVPSSSSARPKGPAQQLDYSRDEEEAAVVEVPRNHSGKPAERHALLHGGLLSGEESEEEEFLFASYFFPRVQASLASYECSSTVAGAAKRGEEMPPNFVERSIAYLMVTDIRVSIYLAVQFLSIVFVVVSIPTSQLDMLGKSCFTYWGFKENCDTATYSITRTLYPCIAISTRLGAGAAFSIITVIIYVVNFTVGIIVICCLKRAPHKVSLQSRIVLGSIGAVTIVTQLISWAVIAGIYSAHYCLDENVLAYGVGFGLNLVSWMLNLLGVVLLLAVPARLLKR